jgi:DNA/RNA-binding domain of Phe-tRNA-synthetase-like protein
MRMLIPHQVYDVAAIAKKIRIRKTKESPDKKLGTKA